MTTHRLRDVAFVLTSNVDKVIDPDEHPVRLCNYVDVYKNNFIRHDMAFNPGSATISEIKKFKLKVDDVVITKDSEARGDIGVPALVKSTDDNLVCGYHLSILRTDRHRMSGPFLYWHLLSKKSQEDFENAANGITRFGLTLGGIKNIPINVPDLPTQRAIADFLDRETARIDSLIEKKQRLVELLGEKLQAKISALVKGSSSEDTVRLRHVVRLNPSSRHLCLEPDTPVTFCPMEAIHDGVGGIDTSNKRALSEVASASYNFFGEGDILLAKVTPCFENGKKALARNLKNGVGFATSEVFVVRPDPQRTCPEYLVYLFSSDEFQYAGRSSMTGAGGLRRISERSILDFPLFVGDRWEQAKIVEGIDAEVAISRRISDKTNASMDRLKEYRSALITSAVTGQIDVTNWSRVGSTDRQLDAIQSEMQA